MNNKNRETTSHPLPSRIHTAVGAEVHDQERGSVHLCHGYDLYNDLLERYTWSELLFLHLKGELPERSQAEAFDFILRSVINPGPKHWATQAAMTAAVTHTPVGNSLLAGLAVLEGRFKGALEVEAAMQLLAELVQEEQAHGDTAQSEILKKHPDLPGFDSQESDLQERIKKITNRVLEASSVDTHLQIALRIARQEEKCLSGLGVFAAALCDLGFSPRQGHGLYLIAAAPGILAHLLEQMEGKWSSYPFGPPPKYVGLKERTLSNEQRCYKGYDE